MVYNITLVILVLGVYQLAYGKLVLLYLILLKVAEPTDDIKWGLTVLVSIH